jgi:hypothetical protein
MRSLRLRLISKLQSEKYTSLYVGTLRSALLETVEDESMNLLLRAPALYELARRGDIAVADFSEKLIVSSDVDEQEVGMTALSLLGTPDAQERLIMLAATRPSCKRHIVISHLAKSLTPDFVRPFGILVRDLVELGELDVSGWSSLAVTTLLNVCSRLGLNVVAEDGSLLERMYMGLTEDRSILKKCGLEQKQ